MVTDISGDWQFNANGSKGTLRIFSDFDPSNLTVEVIFDGLTRTDHWQGTWDDAAGRIVLTRTLPGNVIQTHTGFLGNNDPSNLILAGSFTQSDIPTDAPRTQFGWFAQSRTPIIP